MKLRNNKRKAFTVVELAIVLAILSILATVLIPTFSDAIKDAKKTAAMSAAKNEYTSYAIQNLKNGELKECYIYKDPQENLYVSIKNGTPIHAFTSEKDILNALFDDPKTENNEADGYTAVAIERTNLSKCEKVNSEDNGILDFSEQELLPGYVNKNGSTVEREGCFYYVLSTEGIEFITVTPPSTQDGASEPYYIYIVGSKSGYKCYISEKTSLGDFEPGKIYFNIVNGNAPIVQIEKAASEQPE